MLVRRLTPVRYANVTPISELHLTIFLFLICRSLESLGNIPCKMRIHANDDVYETTRHRMVIAEENSKNKW